MTFIFIYMVRDLISHVWCNYWSNEFFGSYLTMIFGLLMRVYYILSRYAELISYMCTFDGVIILL